MTRLSVRGLTTSYGEVRALHGLDLEIASGQFVALLGPSGSGKTTALRCLAGLESPDGGEIRIGDEVVVAPDRKIFVPPDRRRVGLVFQNYALWPHMTVADTVGYPMRIARVPATQRRIRIAELLELVGMEAFAARRCAQLSGGQQQRVALARALANDSRVMLFDEPLSNLDARLRVSTRAAIREIHRSASATSVYVTHDQEEALALADRIVVMNEGRIEQDADPQTLYRRPASLFVARFLGVENLLEGRVAAVAEDVVLVDVPGLDDVEAEAPRDASASVGDAVVVAVRAADVAVGPPSNGPRGTIADVEFGGGSWTVAVAVPGAPTLHARVFSGAAPRIGDEVAVSVRPREGTVLPSGAPAAVSEELVA
ncbi:MAG: hypothetical protein ABS81_10315 [Pseudonocardia sp. SCN 72-86]|nr:MAG: hypothetical protein ABS81_10315 [Pseudonocardia sp. SCN 72-86]